MAVAEHGPCVQGSGTLGGFSREEDNNVLLYPVPTCWLSRAGSTELALPGHHCGLGVRHPPVPGTTAPLPGAVGVSLCSRGPWIVHRRMLSSVFPWPRPRHSSLPCEPGCGRGYQSPASLGQLSLGSWSPSLPSPCTLVGHGSAFLGRSAPQLRTAQHPCRVGAVAAAQHGPHAAHPRQC